MPTQRDRVLTLLEEGPVCSTTLFEAYIPRAASVIHRLRTENGLAIVTRPCTRAGHTHNTPQVEYELIEASPRLGSNNDEEGPPSTTPAGTEPAEQAALFQNHHRGPEPWLNT